MKLATAIVLLLVECPRPDLATEFGNVGDAYGQLVVRLDECIMIVVDDSELA
jgi:hypothetical protein